MADEASTQSAAALAAPADNAPASSEIGGAKAEAKVTTNGVDAYATEIKKDVATHPSASTDPTIEAKVSETIIDKQTEEPEADDKPTTELKEDVEIKDAKGDDAAPTGDESVLSAVDTPAAGDKSKARRKSGVPEHKTKKLNKKASKAKMTHTDAKPGDYFYIRLKGYPLWPGIVAAEDMLPGLILKSRPVTAAKADGTYREEFADGGNKVNSRTFPVMYLYTNEFSWIPNTDLVDMDLDTVGETAKGMKKDLAAAHLLAAERHDLDYFRESLKRFEEEKLAREAEAEAAAEAAAVKKSGSKAKPKKSTLNAVVNEDDDVEMADATLDPESDAGEVEEAAAEKPKKKSAKRKAEETATPADSAKKPKTIKLNLTPKAPNGTATPKSAKSAKDSSSAKASKPKKKATPKSKDEEEPSPKEPELTAEEKRVKKEKEILFLRHKLQKGLLTRDQDIKEEDMKQMSEYVTKLEGYADLEVSIIRATKINKVLKAILKLNTIPKEAEFQFKPRSQTLLNKWNKLLEGETVAPLPAAASSATTNGVKEKSGEMSADAEDEKASPAASTEPTNGVKQADTEAEDKAQAEDAPEVEAPQIESKAAAPETEESSKDPAPVESTA